MALLALFVLRPQEPRLCRVRPVLGEVEPGVTQLQVVLEAAGVVLGLFALVPVLLLFVFFFLLGWRRWHRWRCGGSRSCGGAAPQVADGVAPGPQEQELEDVGLTSGVSSSGNPSLRLGQAPARGNPNRRVS